MTVRQESRGRLRRVRPVRRGGVETSKENACREQWAISAMPMGMPGMARNWRRPPHRRVRARDGGGHRNQCSHALAAAAILHGALAFSGRSRRVRPRLTSAGREFKHGPPSGWLQIGARAICRSWKGWPYRFGFERPIRAWARKGGQAAGTATGRTNRHQRRTAQGNEGTAYGTDIA